MITLHMNINNDFTLKNYKNLLLETKKIYKFVDFTILEKSVWPKNFAILRHDIDISPENALNIAKLESSVGVKSTFTILLTGQFYNPFEKKYLEIIQQIIGLGHNIGLHFDANLYDIRNKSDLVKALKKELLIIENLLNLKKNIKMFSFHNTSKFTMSCDATKYCGLYNAYCKKLKEKVQYTSDSNGYWIHRSWKELINENHDFIQILTHPEWWNKNKIFPSDFICENTLNNSYKVWYDYCHSLKKGNRVNKSSLSNFKYLFNNNFEPNNLKIIQLWLSGEQVLAFLKIYILFYNNLKKLFFSFITKFASLSKEEKLNFQKKLEFQDYLKSASKIFNKDLEKLFGFNKVFFDDLVSIKGCILNSDIDCKKIKYYFENLLIANSKLLKINKETNLRKSEFAILKNNINSQSIKKWLKMNINTGVRYD